MVKLRMVSNVFAAMIARGPRVRTRAVQPTMSPASTRSWRPIMSAPRCAVLRAASGARARRSVPGLKKAQQLPPLAQTLAPAATDEPEVVELDALWSFVRSTKKKRWVWLALCRRTRQVVAYAIGD